MNNNVVIEPSLVQFQMDPTGPVICIDQLNGVDIKLLNSDEDIEYTLWEGGTGISTITSTGGMLSFGFVYQEGTYTITAHNPANDCNANMIGSATLYWNPGEYSVFPANICPGQNILLSGSTLGVNYTLHLPNGTTSMLPGTGAILNWGPQSITGSYYVTAVATISWCPATMLGSTVVHPKPGISSVKPLGSSCEPSQIGMYNSQATVTYELVHADLTSLPVPLFYTSTGGAFWFPGTQPAGTYKVIAKTTFGCTEVMSGEVVVSPLPTVEAGQTPVTICNLPPYSVNLTGSASNYSSVKWTSPTNPSGSNFLNQFNPSTTYTFTPADISGLGVTLTLTVYGASGCFGTPVSDQVTINILAPVVNAGPDQQVCETEPVALTGTITGGTTTGQWLGGTGVFNPGRTDLNAVYTPAPGETGTTVTLTLETTNAPIPCPNVSNDMTITIFGPLVPGVASASQTTICNGQSVVLTGTVPTGGSNVLKSYQWQ
jgi:hypothetical protein